MTRSLHLAPLRQLLRSIVRRPGSSVLLVLLCALGVGFSTTIFAVVQSVLLTPLPYPAADRLVKPWGVADSFGIDTYPFSWDNYRDYRDEIESLQGLAAVRRLSFTVEGAGRPASTNGARVTENFFAVLGVEPVLGRTFVEGAEASEEGVVLIGHGLWRGMFGEDPEVLGRTIRLDGDPFEVIGVLPPELDLPTADTELFIPLVIDSAPENVRGFHFLRLIGRLADGATVASAEAEMKGLAARLAEAYPDATGELDVRLLPLKDELVGDARRSLGALFSAVQVLFLIAWANIAILLLARGMARHGELQLRASLGASRSSLFGLLLAEALLLAGVGCALGLAGGSAAVSWLPQLDPSLLPRAYEIRFEPALVAWAFGLTLFGALLFGSIPAWAATRASATNLTSARTTDRRTARLNTRLVAVQVALALPLLVASGMQLRSVRALATVDTGFRVDGILTAEVALPRNQFGVPEQKRYIDRAIEELERLPGIITVGAMSHLPLGSSDASIVTYRPDQDGQSGLPNARYRVISAGLLETLGVPLVAGREFDARDDQGDRNVIVIDELLAGALFPDRDPLGKEIRMGSDPEPWEVIGVAGSTRIRALDEEPDYVVYVPILRNKFAGALALPKFMLHAGVSPAVLAPSVREVLQAVDEEQAIVDVSPFSDQVDRWLGSRRAVAWLLWAIAGAALILASAGIYATLAFAVDRRLREMAIRSALGAAPAMLARTVVREGLRPGIAGAAIGVALCVVVSRFFIGVLYGVDSLDATSLAGAVALLLSAALIACAGPTRRATREDPASLLREDSVR